MLQQVLCFQIALLLAGPGSFAAEGTIGEGVVIEVVPSASVLASAGVQPGDLFTSWDRRPSPWPGSRSAAGLLVSPVTGNGSSSSRRCAVR